MRGFLSACLVLALALVLPASAAFQVNNLAGFNAKTAVAVALNLAFVTSTTSTGTAINAPATVNAGDLLVYIDYAAETPNRPADVLPSGFTDWISDNIDTGATQGFRAKASYKIADGSEDSASITGMNGADANNKIMLQFRGDYGIASVTPSSPTSEATGGNAASQSILASGGTPPLIAIGIVGIEGGTAAFSTESPAFAGTVNAGGNDLLVNYTVYNSGPLDHTIDINDLGVANWLAGGYLAVQ